MSTFKGYSSKRAAAKGAVRMGYTEADVYQNDQDQWGFDVEEAPAAPQQEAAATPVQEETHPALAATGTEVKDGQLVPASKPGRKIQKDRPMQNGVKMPSEGTKCREVWDFCASKPGITAKDVKQEAQQRAWNPNNASIEFYNWRKYMDIHGRQAAPAAPAPDAQH